MSDDSERQITRIDGDLSLLSKVGSGLIARGRKDAAILRQPSSPAVSEADNASISQGICNKCGRRKELVLAKCVCASCSEALDRGWAGSAATDWVLVAFPGPEPPTIEGDYDTRSYRISILAELVHDESITREELGRAISSDTSRWPHLYVYTKTTYAEMKEHWAKCNPPDALCLGPMTVDEFYRVARYGEGDELGPWPRGRGEWQDAIPHIRPASSQELDLSEIRQLAEAGEPDAQYKLGWALDGTERVKWFRKAADQGHAFAQNELGNLCSSGQQGVTQDYVEAVRWYRKAAERNLAVAQTSLALAYNLGRGVPQDWVESANWYRKAADQGDHSAQFILGQYYADGHGLPQDLVQAYMWTNLAASLPSSGPQWWYSCGRDEIAAKMTPQQIAEAERMTREWKPTPKDEG